MSGAQLALSVFALFTLGAHLASLSIVLWRARKPSPLPAPADAPGVSVLRPVCGLENYLEETLASSFALGYPNYEIIFCIDAADDPALPLLHRLIKVNPTVCAQIRIGRDSVGANPKLNNLVKGWQAARYDWRIMADCNLLLPPDYIERLMERWAGKVGLVSSPPVGAQPQGIWAELECAFLNTYQARYQLGADQLGMGFAQGKSMLWRRELLENAGGIAALSAEAAEDAAATKIIRRAGGSVRLSHMPFAQPLGARALSDVWRRQLRWARLRRASFTLHFLPELIAGGLMPCAAVAALASLGALHAGEAIAYGVLWYGVEVALARAVGWPNSLKGTLAIVARDCLLAPLWLAAWAGDGFVWRGNAMSAETEAAFR